MNIEERVKQALASRNAREAAEAAERGQQKSEAEARLEAEVNRITPAVTAARQSLDGLCGSPEFVGVFSDGYSLFSPTRNQCPTFGSSDDCVLDYIQGIVETDNKHLAVLISRVQGNLDEERAYAVSFSVDIDDMSYPRPVTCRAYVLDMQEINRKTVFEDDWRVYTIKGYDLSEDAASDPQLVEKLESAMIEAVVDNKSVLENRQAALINEQMSTPWYRRLMGG